MKQKKGFTLIEMLITIVISIILASLAVPSMYSLIQDMRIEGAANDFVTDLNLARSEAIKKRGVVVVSSNSGTDDLSDGWSIWFDENLNGIMDTGELIYERSGLSSKVSFVNDEGNTEFWYSSTGMMLMAGLAVSPDGKLNFSICDIDRSGEQGIVVSIGMAGHPRSDGLACS